MSVETIKERALKFARSSAYRSGDLTSFAVPLHESTLLSGRYSPSEYLDKLGLTSMPERVMIVCPGNGGLVAECFNRGAKTVLAVEPRPRFQQTLTSVMSFAKEFDLLDGKLDHQFRLIPRWISAEGETFKDVPLILWPEGVDEVTAPQAVVRGIAAALDTGGSLFIEMKHGSHGWVKEINSWHPSAQTIGSIAEELFGQSWKSMTQGRLANRRIYELGTAAPAAPTPKKVEKAKEAPPAPPPAPPKAVPAASAPPEVEELEAEVPGVDEDITVVLPEPSDESVGEPADEDKSAPTKKAKKKRGSKKKPTSSDS